MPGLDFMDILISLPGIIIALTFHEYAHALVANRLGDNTAELQGRLTLNPISHLDPIGFIALLIFNFGWAKPVPVNPYNLKNRKKGMLLVSLAGPGMNFALALITLFVIYILAYKLNFTNDVAFNILAALYSINIYLGIFNLIPVPPLDGSKILAAILPEQIEEIYLYRYERYSTIILVVLLYTGIASKFLSPLFNLINTSFKTVVQIFF